MHLGNEDIYRMLLGQSGPSFEYSAGFGQMCKFYD